MTRIAQRVPTGKNPRNPPNNSDSTGNFITGAHRHPKK